MMLDQIEKKQKKRQEEEAKRRAVRTRKADSYEPPRAKTIGAKVPPKLYARLKLLKERRGLKSMKEAILVAAERGLDELIGRDR